MGGGQGSVQQGRAFEGSRNKGCRRKPVLADGAQAQARGAPPCARRLTAAGVALHHAAVQPQRFQRAQLLDGHVSLLPAPQPHLRGGSALG